MHIAIAVTNNGQGKQTLQLIDVQAEKILDNIEIKKSWLGLCFSSDEKKLYASGGNDNWILQYAIIKNKLQLEDSISLGNKYSFFPSLSFCCYAVLHRTNLLMYYIMQKEKK